MTASDVRAFIDCKPFKDWSRGREAEAKIQSAIVDRLNAIIQGANIIAKTVARTR